MDVRDAQGRRLAHAEPAAVQHFQNGAVALAVGLLQIYGFQDGRDFGHGKHGREVLAQLRRVHAVAGILLHLTLLHAPVEEIAEGAHQPRGAALRQAPLRQFSKVFLDIGRADGTRCQVHGLQERLHIMAIGCHRVR